MRLLACAIVCAMFAQGCTSEKPSYNKLSEKEMESKWELLFDGSTTKNWHLYNKPDATNSAWVPKNGILRCSDDPTLERGDLVTDKSYENYQLEFDWQIDAGGNSGVFINVNEQPTIPTAWASGPEYQLLGKGHHDESKPMKLSGCLYGFSPQLNKVDLKPDGQWNHTKIVQKDGQVSFYLNDKLTASQLMKGAEWQSKVDSSGFNKFPSFGKQVYGKIALQNWEKGASFKNIKILKL